VEKLLLTTISDTVIEWAKGKRIGMPEDSKEIVVKEFRLGHQGV
jgi:hypothetical protein